MLPQMWRSRTHWFLFGVSLITFTLTTVLVWVVGAALGFGPIGRFFLELAFHGTFGVAILHTLARRYEEQMRPYVRAALADELMG
ncbi:MAG TPA: hypothetical protein VD866_00860, partial [Urbifossiella sp.]|nr:hypothetical protein [Urbifossiella sp.]